MGVGFPQKIVQPLARAWTDGIRKPNEEETLSLQNKTGLSSCQIDRWFRNAHRFPTKYILPSEKSAKSKTKAPASNSKAPKSNTRAPSSKRKPTKSTAKTSTVQTRQGQFPVNIEGHLKEWLDAHGRNPNNDEARLLGAQTDLHIDQVQSWFQCRTKSRQASANASKSPAVSTVFVDLSASTNEDESVEGDEDEDEPDNGGAMQQIGEERGNVRPNSQKTPRRRRSVRRSQAVLRVSREQELEEENKRLRLHLDERKRDFEEYLEIGHQQAILKEREKQMEAERAELDARRARLLSRNDIGTNGASR